jgi:hypothetical protein
MASDIISGLDFLGRGVDLLELDAFDVANSCKPVQLIFTTKDATYEKEGYTIRSGVEAFLQPQTTVEGATSLMSNAYDFQREFSESMEANAGVDGIFEFSASKTFKTTARESASREDIFTYLIAHHSLCVATLDLFGMQGRYLNPNFNFQNAVKKLPIVADKAAYRGLIQKFGTHFLHTVTLGGMAYSKITSKEVTQSSSSSVEKTFKTDARFTIKKGSAGGSHETGSIENEQRDKEHKITRSSICYVGGKGDPEQIDIVWIDSLKEMSVPIISTKGKKANFVLRRISELLVADFLKDEDSADLATKKKLLDEETSRYIRERGGEECGRIRYGAPVKLTAVGTGRRLYYSPARRRSLGPALYDRDPNEALDQGSSEATFVVNRSNKVSGEEVLTGDPVTMEIQGTKTYLTIPKITPTTGPQKGQLVATLGLSPTTGRPEGEYSLRIRGSGQGYDGSEMQEKRRPLVSGDVVMISRRDPELNKFVILTTPLGYPFGGVGVWSRDNDELLKPSRTDGRDCFVVRNA